MMGRPKAEIDVDQLKRLARLQCTLEEIAGFFDVDKSTISRRFATTIARARAGGKISLRRWQWRAARQGNIRMLIHLGRVELGQVDRIKIVEAPGFDYSEYLRLSGQAGNENGKRPNRIEERLAKEEAGGE